MPDRPIIGSVVHPITAQPWADAPVRFRLLRPFAGAPDDVLLGGRTAITDDAGDLALDLPLPASGQAFYSIVLPDGSTSSSAVAYDDGSTLNLAVLLGGDGVETPLQLRTVYGTLLHSGGNQPWQRAPIAFALQQVFVSGLVVYPKETVSVTTGLDGSFALDLAVPASGQARYRITLPDGTTWIVGLSMGAEPIVLQALAIAAGLVASPGPMPPLPDLVPTELLTRTLLGTILMPPDQSRPWVHAPVKISLDKPFATSFAVWPRATRIIHTDPAGAFAIDLAVPASGSVQYTVELPDTTYVTFLIDAGEPITLQDLMAGGGEGIDSQPTILGVIDARIAQHAGTVATAGQLGHVKSGPDVIVGVDGSLYISERIAEGHDAYYRHVQAQPAAVWTVTHNLGKRPAISITDSTGEQVFGEVVYLSDQAVELRFSVAFSGEAVCN